MKMRVGRGFTLVELIVVIVVIAILAVIGIVVYNGVVGRAQSSLVKEDLHSNVKRMLLYSADNGTLPTSNEFAHGPYDMASKPKISSRKAYKNLSICYGADSWSGPLKEAVFMARTSNDTLFAYSTLNGTIIDLSEQFRTLTPAQ